MVFNTLSGRFLGLTVLFVVIAEVLIFVPSVARFRADYLQNRLELAQLAALALLATPDEEVAPDLGKELLATADVLNVVLRRDDVRELMLESPMPPMVDETFDLRDADQMTLMRDALRVLVSDHDRIIRVIGQTTHGARSEIEVTLHEWPLREAMIAHGRRILYISLALSLATATLLFLAVQRLIVRPIGRVVDHMTAYRDDPEDASRIIAPESGAREIRHAETALQDLELRLTAALRQKERLAGLGGAVAKISHDLRNMLTTAQLLADRIEASPDPGVRRIAPKLVSSLARAIKLCERTLTYGKAEELPPEPVVFALGPLVAEVLENERQAAAPAGCVDFADDVAARAAAARRPGPDLPGPVEPGAQRRAGDRGLRPAGGGDRHGGRERRPHRDPGRRHRPRPAAARPGKPVPAVPRRRAAGRRRARPGHRRRAGQGPRRHAGARGDRVARVGVPHLAAGPGTGLRRRPRPMVYGNSLRINHMHNVCTTHMHTKTVRIDRLTPRRDHAIAGGVPPPRYRRGAEPANARHCLAPVRRPERASAEAEGGAAGTVGW